MLARIAAVTLCLVGLVAPAASKEAVDRAARAWVADVVERVEGTAALVAATTGARKTRTVAVRLSVAADGVVMDVSFGSPQPPEALGKRLRAAIVAAAPFNPPPSELLAPEGATNLNFPLRFARPGQ